MHRPEPCERLDRRLLLAADLPDVAPLFSNPRYDAAEVSFAIAADFDADGDDDIVYGHEWSFYLRGLENNGNGYFERETLGDTIPPNWSLGDLAPELTDGVAADINGDGFVDVLAASEFDGEAFLSVFLYDGVGFRPFENTNLPLGAGTPTAITLGNFDGDTNLDVAISDEVSGTVRLLAGDGAGGFTSLDTINTGGSPLDVAAGDLDGDGLDDLAVVLGGENGALVLVTSGPGGYAVGATADVGRPTAVAIGDVAGGGAADVVVTQRVVEVEEPFPGFTFTTDLRGNALVFAGDGAGGLGGPDAYAVGPAPADVLLADLDLDGRLDVATANSRDLATGDSNDPFLPQDLAVLLNTADGFGDAQLVPGGSAAQAVAVGDYDGDGLPDLAVGFDGSEDFGIYLAASPAEYEPRQITSLENGFFIDDVEVGDLDGDGDIDAIARSFSGGEIALNDGDGNFTAAGFLDGRLGREYELADFDGDGDLDVASGGAGLYGDLVTLNFNNGDGTFADQVVFDLPGEDTSGIAAGDFDNDGDIDLATTNSDDSTAIILLNDGDGTFAEPDVYELRDFSQGVFPKEIVAADLNGDGRDDLATANGNGDSNVLLANADGTFTVGEEIDVVLYSYGNLRHIEAADLDGDGDQDLAWVGDTIQDGGDFSFPSYVYYALNDGDGTFSPVDDGDSNDTQVVEPGNGLSGFTLADADGDGDIDLLTTGSYGRFSVTINNGTRDSGSISFLPDIQHNSGGVEQYDSPEDLAVADFDGDGRPDVLSADTDDLIVHLNVGPPVDDTTPPTVTGVFDVDAAKPQVRLRFSEDVSASLSPLDFVFVNSTTGESINPNAVELDYDAATNVATFSFPGLPGGMLPDGAYVATLAAASVTDAAGNPLQQPFVFTFDVLAADFTRDRAVDLADFTVLANNFGKSGRTFTQGDANYDGKVDLADFTILANRFGAGTNTGGGGDDEEGGLF